MIFKSLLKGHQVVGGMMFLIVTSVATFALLEFIHAPTSADSTAKRSQSSAQRQKTTPISAFEQDVSALNRLYKSAQGFSIDRLIAVNAKNESNFSQTVSWSSDFSDVSVPKQYRVKAHSSNYGNRLKRDVKGRPVNHDLLIVLHETTSTATGAINTMLTPHPRDQDQVSYHAVIQLDGSIVYTVDPRKRAYGAGDSVFKGSMGSETVQTKQNLAASVNNFAYHISLETPSDGRTDNHPQHSGYTDEQYNSLAWLVAQSGVKGDRIATHAKIDQSGERQDPRSFDRAALNQSIALQNSSLISLERSQLR